MSEPANFKGETLWGRSRSVVAAVVLGTAISAGGSQKTLAETAVNHTHSTKIPNVEPIQESVQNISRYCQSCWRCARLPMDQWNDCTQQVMIRLLERVDKNHWHLLLKHESEERRELIRAIDTIKKRAIREKKYLQISPNITDHRFENNDHLRQLRSELDRLSNNLLSPRQQSILQHIADGWSIPEIADKFLITADRVSDEKYKAIMKIQHHLAEIDKNSNLNNSAATS